jgi:hypothetical protein
MTLIKVKTGQNNSKDVIFKNSASKNYFATLFKTVVCSINCCLPAGSLLLSKSQVSEVTKKGIKVKIGILSSSIQVNTSTSVCQNQ